MKNSPPSRWLTVLMLLALLPAARATTIIAPDFDRMVGDSDCIVRAVVKSVTSEWRTNPAKPGQRYIGTLVELDVQELIKGTAPSRLVLDLVGGRVGDTELTVEGAPRFVVGQESILFVQGNGRQVIPLAGLSQGHYPVRRDKLTGRTEVLRSNGKPLYDERAVAQPESALRASPAQSPQTRALTVDEFTARIRKSGRFSSREKLE